MLKSGICLLTTIAMNFAFCSAAMAQKEDHPLLTRYEGSTLQDKQHEAYGSYKLITGRSDKEFSSESLKGELTRLVYENPADRSTLEIFSNYRQSLEGSGMKTIYTCAIDECGPAYARSAWNRFNGLFAAADGDPRYISGKISRDKSEIYIALMVGKRRTQLDILEITDMEENMVVVNADALSSGIDQDGKVSVYGIYFDTDKADIKSDSKAALDEIAKLLKSRGDLSVYIVGHTDMTGTLRHNQDLSQARARAVVRELVEKYGIKAERLEGHGVGPLAPTAPNTSEAGRAKNRRVELVKR